MAEEEPSCEELIDTIERNDDDTKFSYAVSSLRGQLWMREENPSLFIRSKVVTLICKRMRSHFADPEIIGKLSSILQSLFQYRGALRTACSRCRMEIKAGEPYKLCPGRLNLKFHPGCLTCRQCQTALSSFTLNEQKHTFCVQCRPSSDVVTAEELVVAAPRTVDQAAAEGAKSKAELLALAASAPQAPFISEFESELVPMLQLVSSSGGDSTDYADELSAVIRSFVANEPLGRIVACLKYVAQEVGTEKSPADLAGVGVVLRAFAMGNIGTIVKAALRSLHVAATSGPAGKVVQETYASLLAKIAARADSMG